MSNFPWYKEYQDKRMGDVGYQDLDWEDMGLYHYLKCVCAQTRNAGSLTIYGKPHAKVEDIVALAKKRSMRTMRSHQAAKDRSERMVRHLLEAGLIHFKEDGSVFITSWEEEQKRESEHIDATRKRDWRDRQRAEEQIGERPGPTPSAAARGGAPSPPPPASESGSVGSPPVDDSGSDREEPDERRRDMSGTCPGQERQTEKKTETEEEQLRCSGSGNRSPSGREAGGGGEGEEAVARFTVDPSDPHTFPDPIAACAQFTGDYSTGMRSVAGVALNQLGRMAFLDVLKEFSAEKRSGKIRDSSPSSSRMYIVGMWKRRGVVYRSKRIA